MGRPRIIEQQCYIRDLDANYTLVFQMMPEVSISKSVRWNYIEIIGRSHPVLGYASSGPKTYTFTLMFFANPSSEDKRSLDQISRDLRFLESLAYPDYDRGGVFPPHRCLIKLGSQSKMVGVIENVDIYDKTLWKDGKPVYAEAAVTFIEAHKNPVSYSVIRSAGGLES